MPVDDCGAGPVGMLTFPLARERCRCSCGEGARLWAPVVVAGRRARVSRPRLAALDHSFGVPRVGVHVPSLPRRRVRSSRPRTATSGTRSVRRAIAGQGDSGIFHRPDIVAAATASIAPIGTLPDVLDSLTGKKGGQGRTGEPPAPAPAAGDGRRDRFAAGLRAVEIEVEVGEVGLRTVVGELNGGLERLVEHERVAVKRG